MFDLTYFLIFTPVLLFVHFRGVEFLGNLYTFELLFIWLLPILFFKNQAGPAREDR